MKHLKALLIKILGRPAYLSLLSKVYLFSFRKGWLRSNPSYRTHYFVRNLIKEGDTVIDIGANLGYYSTEFARLVGSNGKVWSVEPIPMYRKVLLQNVKSLPQVTVLPYALGETEGTISMGLPFADQHRHGLMKVLTKEEKEKAPEIFEVELKHPQKIFSQLSEIQYIKCDIEGYEVPVIPAMRELISQQMPVMQIETEGENKRIICDLLNDLGYHLFFVGESGLVPFADPSQLLPGDLIGIPPHRLADIQHLTAHA